MNRECSGITNITKPTGLLSARNTTLSHLHAVNTAVLGPSPEGLAEVEEDDTAQAPEQNQRGVGHDRGDVSALDDPWSDEL